MNHCCGHCFFLLFARFSAYVPLTHYKAEGLWDVVCGELAATWGMIDDGNASSYRSGREVMKISRPVPEVPISTSVTDWLLKVRSWYLTASTPILRRLFRN